jgi:hypothetical protein
VLLVLTLISSAVHFADNAFRPELYSGPVWLTRNTVLSAWLAVLTVAYVAYRLDTRWALIVYETFGFAGLAHYLMPHRLSLPLRCTATIGAETTTSVKLIVYALLQPHSYRSLARLLEETRPLCGPATTGRGTTSGD